MTRSMAPATAFLLVAACSTGEDRSPASAESGDASAAGGTSSTTGGATGSASGGAAQSSGGVASGGGAGGTPEGGGAVSGTGGSGAGDAPAACPASDEGNVPLGQDVFVPDTGKTEVASLAYTNVGASGAYAEVVSGWSQATGCVGDPDGTLCETVYKQEKRVSGPLSPFDEEMSMVFAGPVELYQIAVYRPGAGAWERVAFWDRCTTEGLVFAGNKSWFECGGFVESYVTPDGTAESDAPVQFSGSIAAGTEVHVQSSALCAGSECGYSSGLPLHGFGGDSTGSKIFATKFRMPLGTKTPAYWILPTQVIRSSQYGCNCRGMGSDPVYEGGCGELDVAEILGGVTTSVEATTTLYSFQGITGGGSVAFNRPVEESATFLVIFDAATSSITIRRLGATEFDFGASLSTDRVSALLSDPDAVRSL